MSEPSARSASRSLWPTIFDPAAMLWLAIAFLATLGLIRGYDIARWATTPWPGFSLDSNGRLLIEAPLPDASAEAVLVAGFEGRLLRARGEGGEWRDLGPLRGGPTESWRRLRALLEEEGVGGRVELAFAANGDGAEALAVVPLRPLPLGVLFARGLLLPLMGIAVAGIGATVYRARPAAPEAVLFALFALATASELVAGAVHGGPPSALRPVELLGAALAPAAGLALAAAIEPRPWLERRPWLLLVPGAAGVACLLFDLQWDGAERRPALAVLRVAALVLFTSWLLWLRATTRVPARRQTFDFYLAGMVGAFAFPVIAYSWPRASGEPTPWVALTLLLFPATMGYGILRHRLFDIDLVLRRSALWALLSGLGLASYGALVALTGALVGGRDGGRSPLLTAAFVAVAVALGGTLKSKLQRLLDRRLAPERFRYLEAVREAGAEVGRLSSEDAVAWSLARTATTVAGLEGAAVFLERAGRLELVARSGETGHTSGSSLGFDEPLVRLLGLVSSELHRGDFADNPRLAGLRESCLPRMDELQADLLVLMGADGPRPLGLLALGPPGSGEPFNHEDLDLFRSLAGQAALAVARARSRAVHDAPTIAPARIAGGAHLLHYRLEAPLGAGGMGSVWRAVDEKLGRTVALKLLPAGQAGDGSTLERLRLEARALAALSHPSILQIHALEESAGTLFLVIELVEGADLAAVLRQRGPLPEHEVVAIVSDVAGALAFAAEHGIIHRDLKPANILRTIGGRVKLADFGLARQAGEDRSLTGSGNLVGTLAYMAPELLTGKAADQRSDMYSLGIVIHELLTGTVPERGRPLDTAALGKSLGPIVARLLEPDPSRRYADYPALLADLSGH